MMTMAHIWRTCGLTADSSCAGRPVGSRACDFAHCTLGLYADDRIHDRPRASLFIIIWYVYVSAPIANGNFTPHTTVMWTPPTYNDLMARDAVVAVIHRHFHV